MSDKKLKIAIQADHIKTLKPQSDSTLMIAAAFCEMGHSVFFYTPEALFINSSLSPLAFGDFVNVRYDGQKSTYELLSYSSAEQLDKHDILLIRNDPPFDMDYIHATYMLFALEEKILVASSPTALRNFPEKILPLILQKHTIDFIITSNINSGLLEFLQRNRQVVIKPLYGHGGNDVILIDTVKDHVTVLNAIILLLKKHKYIVLQEYLAEVIEGDIRIITMGEEIVGAIRRIPGPGDIRANLAVGGTAHKTELTKIQTQIAMDVAQYMNKEGVLFTGIDMIGDKLIEVNITSPTTLVAIDRLYGKNLARHYAQMLVKRRLKMKVP